MTPLPATRLTGSLCAHAKLSSEVVSLGFTIMIPLSMSSVRKEWLVVLLWMKAKSRYLKDKPDILKSLVPTVYYNLLILL